MNKKLIRLTESDLHKIVKESVSRILNEIDYDANKNALEGRLEDYYEGDPSVFVSRDELGKLGDWYEKDKDKHERDIDKVRQRDRIASKIDPLELKQFAKKKFFGGVNPKVMNDPLQGHPELINADIDNPNPYFLDNYRHRIANRNIAQYKYNKFLKLLHNK